MKKEIKDFSVCLLSDLPDDLPVFRSIPRDDNLKVNSLQLKDLRVEHLSRHDLFVIATEESRRITPDLIRLFLSNHSEKNTALAIRRFKPREVIHLIRAGFAEVFELDTESDLLQEWIFEKYEEKLQGAGTGSSGRNAAPLLRIIGKSQGMEKVRQLCMYAARMPDMTVLIQGATGTGKELLAKIIHELSERTRSAFVEVNCSAIPENLMEAEMFGYEKGAFTDAQRQKQGIFELARGGTLFLDEIGVMSLNLQNKLLKAVEEKKIRRLGSERELEIDTRIIAGTNVDLKEASKTGQFRADLYYRLNVFSISIPSLAERTTDIRVLADYFLEEINKRYNLNVAGFHPVVIELFENYPWPGNVRELKHTIERSAVLAQKGRILPTHLPDEIQKLELEPKSFHFETSEARDTLTIPLPSGGYPLEEIEKYIVREILTRFRGNQSKTADYLKISRTRLIRKLPKRHDFNK